MSSSPGGWSSLEVIGQAPPPCSSFTLTTVGEKRAAMYGGWDGSNKFNHLFIAELGRHFVVRVIIMHEVCVCVRVECVYACVHACVCACMRACVSVCFSSTGATSVLLLVTQ